jgi:hypothetical protein
MSDGVSPADFVVTRLVARDSVTAAQRVFAAIVSGKVVSADTVEARKDLIVKDGLHAQAASFAGQVTVGSLITFGSIGAADVNASNMRVVHDLSADQVTARVVAADELKATSITGARLHGTMTPVAVNGVDIGGGISAVVCAADAVTVTDPSARTRVAPEVLQATADPGAGSSSLARPTGGEPSPFPRPPVTQPVAARIALFHQYTGERDQLVVNHLGRYADGVRVVGDLHLDGALVESSSTTLKEGVEPVRLEAATSALAELEPVSYRYRDDPAQTRRLGFIAEDVPDLVAQPSRDRIRTMDLVAVLTTVVQAQQRSIASLRADIAELKSNALRAGSGGATSH